MSGLSANRVLSGSFAEIWVDGNRIAEASGIQMTVKLIRSEVQIGMDVDSKITGCRGEGQLRLRQVFSRFFDVVENAAAGADLRVTITTALKDPDSMTDTAILSANTGSCVFLRAEVRFADAMEDLSFEIAME